MLHAHEIDDIADRVRHWLRETDEELSDPQVVALAELRPQLGEKGKVCEAPEYVKSIFVDSDLIDTRDRVLGSQASIGGSTRATSSARRRRGVIMF